MVLFSFAVGAALALGALRPIPTDALNDSTPLVRRPKPSGLASGRAKPDTTRPHAIEYSDWYNRRLTVHRWGSYAMLPLFAAEYALGNKLLQSGDVSQSVRDNHRLVASGLGVLFVTNSLTGAWNLVQSWPDRVGRNRRVLHTALMLASDAGFAWTGSLGGEAREERSNANLHRNAALMSMGLSAVGTVMMWFWKD